MSDPWGAASAVGPDEYRAELFWQNRRIHAALKLHFPHTPETAAILGNPKLVGWCAECRRPYPCPTTTALEQ